MKVDALMNKTSGRRWFLIKCKGREISTKVREMTLRIERLTE